MKILIAGYYGFGNLGDELILSTVLSQIHQRYPASSVIVLSADPQETAQRHQVSAVSRWKVGAILSAMWKSDILLLGGGGLLQNKTSNRSLIYYLSLVGLAHLFQNHVVLYAMGVESVRGLMWERLIRFLLSGKRLHITVRDEGSKDLLLKMGLRPNAIHVTADPVFTRTAVETPKERYSTSQPAQALLIPRLPAPKVGETLFDRISQVLIEENNVAVKAAVFQPSTEWAYVSLGKMKTIPFVDSRLFQTDASAVGFFDFIVSARFHGLVLAALSSRPFIGVGDPDKIKRLCDTFGMPFLAWDAGELEIRSAIKTILSPDRPLITPAALDKWRSAAHQTVETIAACEIY